MALVQGTSNALNSGLRGSYQASRETHLLKYGSANIPKAVNTDLASQRDRIRTTVPVFSALVRQMRGAPGSCTPPVPALLVLLQGSF